VTTQRTRMPTKARNHAKILPQYGGTLFLNGCAFAKEIGRFHMHGSVGSKPNCCRIWHLHGLWSGVDSAYSAKLPLCIVSGSKSYACSAKVSFEVSSAAPYPTFCREYTYLNTASTPIEITLPEKIACCLYMCSKYWSHKMGGIRHLSSLIPF
jgi:hypothetical protein